MDDPTKIREGRDKAARNILLDRTAIISITEKRARDVIEFLHKGLTEVVYTFDDNIVVEHVQTLVDLKTRMRDISNIGAVQRKRFC